ncbi:serine/threonine protein kinase [bacterium]|nr:serine/threonine protein kinase [bacterium]
MLQTERFDDTHFLSLGGSTRELKPGDIVGGTYILKSLLGQGGMGYVFLAEHNIIKKDYALKIIRPDKMDDFSWKRFEIEGRVIAKLDNPNIVKIYNMGVDQGKCPFYVMDLLSGEPLSEYINRGVGLTFEQCLDIFRQVAEGLAYAHRKGIVHRDVKPANIILLKVNDDNYKEGFQAKVVDFGLAKVINPDASQAITAKGQIFGSPYYMSPEQCQGQAVDCRSDIYSLGCALFESIAGEPPFIGANAIETMLMHTEETMPKLADRFSEGPAVAVDSLIARMTAKEPHDRYQSMDEVAAALGRLQKHTPLLSSIIAVKDNSARAADVSDSSAGQSSSLISRVDSRWLFVGSILVTFSLLAAGVYLYAANNKSKPATAGPQSDMVALLNFGPIKSHPLGATGYKEIVFPPIAIGLVGGLGDTKPRLAVGSVRVVEKGPVVLSVDENEVPLTFKYPQVFEQIGKDEFQALYLKAKGSLVRIVGTDGHGPALDFSGMARRERIAHSQKQLIAILKIVSTWPSLVSLTLDGFTANDQVFHLLDQQSQVSSLSIKRAEFNMKELIKCQCFDRLTSFLIEEPVDSFIDPLLYRLAECRNLTFVELDSVDFLPGSLSQLNRCPKLKTLYLNKADISDEVTKVIAQMKNLSTFRSEGKSLTESQIATLAKRKNLLVILEAKDYASQTDQQGHELLSSYRAKFPTIIFQ